MSTNKLTEPVYTVVAPKEKDEISSRDPRIQNCQIIIFRTFNGNPIHEPYKAIKENYDDLMEKIRAKTPQLYNEMKNKMNDILSRDAFEAKIEEPIECIWLEDQDWNTTKGRSFTVPGYIDSDAFSLLPKLPSYIERTLQINSIDDMNKLINNAYIVKAYTSPGQYKKELALYYIRNKKLYNMEETSDMEIWNKIMYPGPPIYEPSWPEESVLTLN